MRSVLLVGWLLLPLAFGAWHYGPGQEKLLLDDVDHYLQHGAELAAAGQYSQAVDIFNDALAKLPKDRVEESQRIRVERAKAQLQSGQLPEAHDDLTALVAEMSAEKGANPAVLAAARSTLANSQYYLTWLMRLEGAGREIWEPEIDAARQSYRLLAEEAEGEGDTAAASRHREDLESAIRLARMEPGDLQGQPLPKQCKGCCSGKCQGKKPGKNPNKNGEKKDARGAGSGAPPDDGGN